MDFTLVAWRSRCIEHPGLLNELVLMKIPALTTDDPTNRAASLSPTGLQPLLLHVLPSPERPLINARHDNRECAFNTVQQNMKRR